MNQRQLVADMRPRRQRPRSATGLRREPIAVRSLAAPGGRKSGAQERPVPDFRLVRLEAAPTPHRRNAWPRQSARNPRRARERGRRPQCVDNCSSNPCAGAPSGCASQFRMLPLAHAVPSTTDVSAFDAVAMLRL
jgi:hypothetical protein